MDKTDCQYLSCYTVATTKLNLHIFFIAAGLVLKDGWTIVFIQVEIVFYR